MCRRGGSRVTSHGEPPAGVSSGPRQAAVMCLAEASSGIQILNSWTSHISVRAVPIWTCQEMSHVEPITLTSRSELTRDESPVYPALGLAHLAPVLYFVLLLHIVLAPFEINLHKLSLLRYKGSRNSRQWHPDSSPPPPLVSTLIFKSSMVICPPYWCIF